VKRSLTALKVTCYQPHQGDFHEISKVAASDFFAEVLASKGYKMGWNKSHWLRLLIFLAAVGLHAFVLFQTANESNYRILHLKSDTSSANGAPY
jgi:hypothetical protein